MSEFIITLLFGWLGVHKFMQRKYGIGILYLFTLGLCGIGWLIDTIIAFGKMVSENRHIPETQSSNTVSNKYGTYGKQQIQSLNIVSDKYGTYGKQQIQSSNTILNNEYGVSEKYLRGNNLQNGNQIKVFTELQLKGMMKAEILELASGLGYAMETIESNTKDKIVADFLMQQEKQPSVDNKKWLIKTFNTEIVGTFAKCDLDKSYERSDIICSLKPNSKVDLEYWEYKGEPAFYVCNKGLDAGCVPASISKILHDVYGDCELVVTLRGEAFLVGKDWMQKIKIDVYK